MQISELHFFGELSNFSNPHGDVNHAFLTVTRENKGRQVDSEIGMTFAQA